MVDTQICVMLEQDSKTFLLNLLMQLGGSCPGETSVTAPAFLEKNMQVLGNSYTLYDSVNKEQETLKFSIIVGSFLM